MVRLKRGQIVLGGAALVLGFALAWSAMHKGGGTAQQGAPATEAALDPMTALERRTRDNPGDSAAWRALGSARFDAGQFAEAAQAYERASQLAPELAVVWSSLGEARVMASKSDPMPPSALEAFRKAVSLDPKDPRARYFLAVNRDLAGDHQGAIADWLTLLADTPHGAPWEADLRRTIEQVGKINAIDVAGRLAAVKPAPAAAPVMAAGDPVATGAIPGPSPEQMHAASALPAGAQDQMVQGMVGRLEGKLKADPGNVDGWIMLMRSRMTLGEAAKAGAARDAAVAANPGAAARIRDAAATLGVPGSLTAGVASRDQSATI